MAGSGEGRCCRPVRGGSAATLAVAGSGGSGRPAGHGDVAAIQRRGGAAKGLGMVLSHQGKRGKPWRRSTAARMGISLVVHSHGEDGAVVLTAGRRRDRSRFRLR